MASLKQPADSQETLVPSPVKKEGPVSWSSLPRKGQLAILVCARMSEPLTQSSLRSYMYYQLQSFDRSLPASTIAWQAGALASIFTFAQFLTAIIWGKLADSEYCGRKRVLLIGLMGTGISAVGFGFSGSFVMALAFRFLGGILNGNVGVMRTMVSEMIREKKYQSRAFMILPMTANIGTIIGPMIGTRAASSPLEELMSLLTVKYRWFVSRTCNLMAWHFWTWIVSWRREWCAVDDEISICLAQSDQRLFPDHIRYHCGSRTGRGEPTFLPLFFPKAYNPRHTTCSATTQITVSVSAVS
jgi:Major Facilitator Superfamily